MWNTQDKVAAAAAAAENEAVTLSKTTTTLASTPPRFWAPELSNLIYIHFACVVVVDFSLSSSSFAFAQCLPVVTCVYTAQTLFCAGQQAATLNTISPKTLTAAAKLAAKFILSSAHLFFHHRTHAQHLHCQSLGKWQFGSFFFFGQQQQQQCLLYTEFTCECYHSASFPLIALVDSLFLSLFQLFGVNCISSPFSPWQVAAAVDVNVPVSRRCCCVLSLFSWILSLSLRTSSFLLIISSVLSF